jgi:hypothetical protein
MFSEWLISVNLSSSDNPKKGREFSATIRIRASLDDSPELFKMALEIA